jgi:predicted GIY-YIG superfamily endonuclease
MTQWTKEICWQEALKYQTKRDFRMSNRNAYSYAYQHGFLDEICSHMIKLGDRKHKCVYCYEFPDNHVYVGITYDFFKRKRDREKRLRDTVTHYKNETGLIPIHIQLTDYIREEEAVLLEAEFVKEYEKHNWIILNKIKTGGVGGDILYWTKEKCLAEGLKYDKRSNFSHYSKGAYDSAKKHGWLEEIYSHIKSFNRKDLNLYWTKERCETKALLCDTRAEFKKKYSGAYDSAKRHDWLKEISLYFITPVKKVWTLEECKQEALKYTIRYDFRTKSNKIYLIARKNNWLDEICSHMIKRIRSGSHGGSKRKWTDEKCLESALKCESFVEWRTKDKGAYIAAHKYGLFEKCVKHMKRYK